MDLQNFQTTPDIGVRNHHLTIKTTRAQEGRVENIGTVGRGNQNDAFIRLETIHLNQQLVKGLLTFIVATAKTGTAMATDRINFIDKDDTGSVLFPLHEKITNTAGTDADKHFDKVGTGNGKERDAGLTRNRTGQKGFAGSRRTNQQHALGNLATQLGKLLRIPEKLDNLFQFLLGLVNTGHIFKGHQPLGIRQQLGLAFAEAHRLTTTGLHLAHEEDPDGNQ